MERRVRVGVGLLCGCLASWVMFFVCGSFMYSGMTSRQLMTIVSPQRAFYMGTIWWLVLASLVLLAIVSTGVSLRLRRAKDVRFGHLMPFVAFAGRCALFVTFGYIFMIHFVLSMPGLKEDPTISHQKRSPQATPVN